MNALRNCLKSKCPGCGSKHLYTQNFDQICLDCDWNNAAILVQNGQMDHIYQAALDHFPSEKNAPTKVKNRLSNILKNFFCEPDFTSSDWKRLELRTQEPEPETKIYPEIRRIF